MYALLILMIVSTLIGVWWILRRQSREKLQSQIATETDFASVINSLSSRERTEEELLEAEVGKLDFPYTICYYPNQDDPSRWFDNPQTVTAQSSILRRTKPFAVPLNEVCTGSSTIQYDFRTNSSTINESTHRKLNEVVKLFLKTVYPNIDILEDTLATNLTYSPTSKLYFLSVLVAYFNTTTKVHNVLVNQFRLNAIGGLVNEPPQSLTTYSGSFNQIVRKGDVEIVTSPLRFVFFSAKGIQSPRITLYAKPLYADRLTTLSLNEQTTTFAFIALPTGTERLFLNVEGDGNRFLTKVMIDSFFSLTITPNAPGIPSTIQTVNHKFVIFKLFTFNPLTTAIYTYYKERYKMDAYFRPREEEIRQGILRIYSAQNAPNAPYSYTSTAFQNVFKAMNNGDMNGMYMVPQLTSDKMDCSYYTKAEGEQWLALYNQVKNTSGMVKDPNQPFSDVYVGNLDMYWKVIFVYAFNEGVMLYSNPKWDYALKYYPRNGGNGNVANPAFIEYGVTFNDKDYQCNSIAPGESFNN